MWKKCILLLVSAPTLSFAASTVYLRSSAPAAVQVSSTTNATPTCLTTNVAHGLNKGDTVIVWGVANNTSANGVRKVKNEGVCFDSTHVALTDLSGSDIAANGSFTPGISLSYIGKATSFTTNNQPSGLLDGPSGNLMKRLSLGTANGLSSLLVANNVSTVTVSYTITCTSPRGPNSICIGDKVAIWNSTSTALNWCNGSSTNVGCSYTITNAWVSSFTFTTVGVTNGDYTTNNTCGPGASPNGTIQGTDNCVRVSQLGYVGNPTWDALNSWIATTGWATGIGYKSIYDGGTRTDASYNEPVNLAWAADIFLVDQKNQQMLDISTYTINHMEHVVSGVNFTVNEAFNDSGNNNLNDFTSYAIRGLALPYLAARPYLTTSQRQVFANKVYNDLDDPSGPVCTKSALPIQGTGGETVTRSGTTITGSGTHFTTELSVGDAIAGGSWDVSNVTGGQSYVSQINSDTSLTVINNVSPTIGASPLTPWFEKQWTTGSCGLMWAQKHWQGYPGSNSTLYPQNGGTAPLAALTYSPTVGGGANNGYTWQASHMDLGFALVDDDTRAIKDTEFSQSNWFDLGLQYNLAYQTGFAQSGSYYSFGRVFLDSPDAAFTLQNAVSSFPSMDTQGNWISGIAYQKIYNTFPDLRNAGNGNWPWAARFGCQTGQNQGDPTIVTGESYLMDAGMMLAPTNISTQYIKSWLTGHGYLTSNHISSDIASQALLKIDPRITATDYTTLPLQYLFNATSQATCAALTGWTCSSNFGAYAAVSRTDFNNTASTSTTVMYESRGFWGDHDLPEGGSLRIYKVGALLNSGEFPPGAGVETDDTTNLDAVPQFGGSSNLNGGVGTNGVAANATISRWASKGNGSFGDASSRYMYVASELKSMYNASYNHVQREVIHFKKPGTEEIIIQHDDIDAGSSVTGGIAWHLHYPQNQQASDYQEGSTSCPGGCASINTNRVIVSTEDGSGPDTNGPKRNFDIITKIFSPATITVVFDSTTYTGSLLADERASLCSGSSCGATAQKLESVVVHKISTISDTSLTAVALNPDSNWTGVQTTDKVALFTRGGVSTNTLTSFTTTHAGTAQYLFAGLSPGSYTVMVGGTPVSGSPFAVAANDNSLYFESAAGVIALSQLSQTVLPSQNWSGTTILKGSVQLQ